MNATAIVMMIVAMIVVWGGLVASIIYLRMRPERTDLPDEGADLLADDAAREQKPHPTRDT